MATSTTRTISHHQGDRPLGCPPAPWSPFQAIPPERVGLNGAEMLNALVVSPPSEYFFTFISDIFCFYLSWRRQMNMRSVLFCGLVTCIVGSVLGLAVAEINRGDRNPKSHLHYSIGGAAIGLIMGSAQEAIRQKAQEAIDEEDTMTSYKH